MPVTTAALLLGLLPAQAFAVPPDPATAETGRETLALEELERDTPVSGTVVSKHLATLQADIPKDVLTAPSGTITPPSNLTGSVTFGSTTTPASARTAATTEQTALSPVASTPVSLGQAPEQPTPTGTWQVTIPDRTSPVSQGVDGAVVVVQAPATGSVPVSIKLDYSKFQNLYGADWASRLRFVQFPDCYLDTPDDEACQAYEELETTNDTASKSLTATVDPAADGTVTPASATSPSAKTSGVAQASYRTSTAAVPAAAGASTAVVGAMDSGAAESSSFKATPLASDGKWEAGGSSGAFTWSYPLTVPAPPAGPAPKISFDYNSQTVDGRTAVSSGQASWIGEGWDYDPGHIERRYRSCQDDRKSLKSGTPNNTAKKDKTSDLCWVSYNAVMSLAGKTTELVRDAPAGSNPETDTEIYRPQQDDGTRVERRTGGTNGDDNGEYWVVTTTDGTQYFYGLNKVGGGHADTDSVSTVPVFGNHPNEPCHAAAFADSRCGAGKQQAWRWGLDKVVDVNDNVMVIDWAQSINHYAVNKKYKSPEAYERAAYPDLIEYGMRSSDLTKPSAKVDLQAAQRCLASATVCDGTNFDKTSDPAAYRPWWDSPGNLNCKSTSKLCPNFPSFWTRLRLSAVTTYGQRPGSSGLQKVDTYTLHQSFPQDWYDTAPGLWLNSITRTGYGPGDTTGTLQSKDGVSFAPYTVGSDSPKALQDQGLLDRQLPNLVRKGKSDQRPGFTRPRIGVVSTEYGGDIEVEYTGGCPSEPDEDKGKRNGTCYPIRWSPDGDEKTPAKAWFNKYVVDSVKEIDKVTPQSPTVVTKYTYSDAAWAKSDDEFTRPALRTYSDWRGYRQVEVIKGSKSVSEQGDVNSQSYSVTRYFQGAGGEVKDSQNKYTLLADDAPQYAGMTAESITYRNSDGQSDGQFLKRTLNYPWSKQTASRSRENEDATDGEPLVAHRTGIKQTDDIQAADSSWRAVRTLTTVDDTYGLPTQVETAVVKPNGSGETLSDQTCTKTSYLHNTSAWLIGLPKEQRTTGTSCAGYDTADPATKLKSAVRNSYDGLAYGATPTKGMVRSVAEIDGTGTSYSVVTDTTYDALGRARTVTKSGTGTTETQYTPDTGGPVTETKMINALGQTTTTTFDAGRGLPLTVTDPNGNMTRNEYDALGRLVKGWSPSRSSGGKSPNVMIDYQPATASTSENRPAAVTVSTLKDDGDYTREITLYDGLMREVQKQAEAHGPGRIITDSSYDDHGLLREQTGAYLAKSEPETKLFAPKSKAMIPSSTKHWYDGLEREIRTSTYHNGDYEYATYTAYSDTSTYVNPAGSTAPRTRTYFDALGRVTSIKHYTQDDSASTAGRATTYEYDARGNRTKVTDPAGNEWSSTYDSRGRVTSTTDPDTGTTYTKYDAADRLNYEKNARSQETFTEYDDLGRVRKVRVGSVTSTPVKENTYDSALGGIGKPLASIRHTDQGDYVNRVTGYDADYHIVGAETVIPANSMTAGVAGTYAYTYTYTQTGKPQSVTLPAVGGLAKEKVVTRYNGDGLTESTSGLTWYTADATYSPYGEPLRTVSGSQPARVWSTNFVDPHTGRLQRTVTDREVAGPHRLTDSYVSYDASGTITSNARQLTDAAGNSWDTQCFTYDVMGELTHAWTSKTTPDGMGTGCKASNGAAWGYRTDYAASSGPVADAPDAATDVTSPDSALASTLAAAAPDAATVSTGTTAYRQSFAFDWLGNRATMTEHDPADASKNVTYAYRYGKTITGNGTTPSYIGQPHTVTTISSTPSGKGSLYTYDDAGNTTVRDLPNTTQSLVWSAEDKLDSITDDGKKTTYVYDASGNRLLENSTSGSTLYLGETELTTNASGSIVQASRAYAQAGAPTVVRSTSNGATTGHKLNVLIADNLGTANTTVELSSTQPVTRRAYKPYGELRGLKPTTWPNKRSYLGVGIDDASTGLTHIGAREYDQNSGRFLSADPIVDISDPLQMNGYAYSNNSPVSKSDPTGLMTVYDPGGSDPPAVKEKKRKEKRAVTAYNNTVLLVAIGAPYAKRGAADRRHMLVKYNLGNNPITDSAYMMWLYGASEEEADIIAEGPCLIVVCGRMDLPQQVEDLPLSQPNPGVELGKALADGMAAGERQLLSKATRSLLGRATGCTRCFLAGTRVLMSDGSKKNIEDVKVGDRVRATDPKTGVTKSRKVTRLIITEDDKHFNELSIATARGIEKLTATNEHPFWSPSERDWVAAGRLKPGMTLLTEHGRTVIVTGNRGFKKSARTYNLTVDELHTYYVLAGATPLLVHNSNCGKIDLGNGLFQHPDGSIRTAKGHFAGSNGTRVGAEAEASVWDSLEQQGMKIIRRPVAVRGNGNKLRIFDGAIDIGHDQVIGIEVKSGSASLTAAQKRFDTWLNTSGGTASGVGLSSGSEAVGVYMWNVP
ncbi:polymorphic toxin-type HINT domain-containing protein [Streptomyces sp. NPDC051920]|uniref:polymorphic toxin-type HINT domain-containing protein n=1 Tax=Streptomyces sp. NPDC051920 TaxID=3155523 RepID=UPI00343DBCAD